MIFVDTNVLLYATGSEHPLRAPSQRLVAAIRDGRAESTTTHLVIQKFLHVRGRRKGRPDAVALARDFTVLLGPLVVADDDVLRRSFDLFARHDLEAADALIASAAIEAGVTAFVSADRRFSGIRGLRHVAPGTPEFDELIA